MNRNPDHMSNEEVVSEVATLQDEIKTRAFRVHALADSLYRRVRRSPVDDSTTIYMTYANAVIRYAGAVRQVSNRTIRTSKVLDRLSEVRAESADRERERQHKQQRQQQREERRLATSSPMESLIRTYVEESLTQVPTGTGSEG